jgi:hypothetical protein
MTDNGADFRRADVNDQDLENELREIAARVDPVPAHLLLAAEAAFAWRTVDAELAGLVFDSLTTAGSGSRAAEELAPVRGGGPRMLTFQTPGLTVELEVTRVGGAHRLLGQLLPPGAAHVEIRHPDGVFHTEADELGRFAAEQVTAGPISIRCLGVVTDWVAI